MHQTQRKARTLATVLAILILLAALPVAAETTFTFGGYVKLDAIATDYSDGDPGPGSAIRDFHIPGAVPVGGESGSTNLDFHAKQSRFNLGTTTTTESGKTLKVFMEMDFMLPSQGDERVSNSYNPRMRHFFFQYDKWLFGQTWSTFLIVSALPDDMDFIGVADGSIFVRQPMIRYTNGPWQLAIENPETTVTPYGGGGRIVTDDGLVPDVVGRYNFKGDWGDFAIAGLFRMLTYDNTASGGTIDDSVAAYGISLGGKFKIGAKDDIRVQASYGAGLGRYIGLNFQNGAVIDATGNLEAIDQFGGFFSYLHYWNDKWSTSANVDYLAVDNPVELTGLGVNESAVSYSANFQYHPTPKAWLGLEYMHATRDLESGASGDMDRFQFSAKYAFSFSGTH